MHIETGRMVIRDFAMNDLRDLHAILGDGETMKYLEPAYSMEKTASFLQEFCIEKKGAFAAVLKEFSVVIGYILFSDLGDGVYEMGWIFNRAYWRKGYAHEACRAVIDHAFDSMIAHKICAETIDADRSVNLMKKLGMKPEGIQRSHVKDPAGSWADVYLYGILAR